tara:strand:+ start:2720 stop:3307 length:588 start_codon:yes stop_codon:yes gene_type:complete
MINIKKTKSILFLGYDSTQTILLKKLRESNFNVKQTSKKINELGGYDLIISFGYKHILSKDAIKTSDCEIINLHISYLPWNRGSHPNFWSFYDKTISGVTIHLLNEGIDKGDILYQKKLNFNSKKYTFFETYKILINEIELLLLSKIESILNKTYISLPQIGEGTFHSKKDLPKDFSGWHSNIYDEIKKLKKNKN